MLIIAETFKMLWRETHTQGCTHVQSHPYAFLHADPLWFSGFLIPGGKIVSKRHTQEM